MKIVYCINSIRVVGGMEMVTINKANALADINGNEVYIVVIDNVRGEPFYNISPKVKLIDFKIDFFKNDYQLSKLRYFFNVFYKKQLYKHRLKEFFKQLKPDIVVSVGDLEKNILPGLRKYVKAIIREFHFTRNFQNIENPKFNFFKSLGLKLENYYLKKYDHIIVLTREDLLKNWNEYKNVSVIPNPITFQSKQRALLENAKVISVGRLHFQKNYDSLIRAFRIVVNRHPGWSLDIYGPGPEKQSLQTLIHELQLDNNVFLKGRTSNVQEKMLEASCFVLSSRYEGLPLVIIEAMSCGLPIVSYDCPCGPKDIISDGIDGFLVPYGDEETLADKICILIEHPKIRQQMGNAAFQKADNYSTDKITQRWMNLFENITSNK